MFKKTLIDSFKLNSCEPVTIHIKASQIHSHCYDVIINNVDKFYLYKDGITTRCLGLSVVECIKLLFSLQKLHSNVSLTYYENEINF